MQDDTFYPYCYEENILWREGNKVVLRPTSATHMCGYVGFNLSGLPQDWQDKGYDVPGFNYLAIHGGITYAKEHDDYVVYGFDCAHVDDEWNLLLQDIEQVAALTRQMEDQLLAFAHAYSDFIVADRESKVAILQKIIDTAAIPVGPSFGAMLDMLSGGPDWYKYAPTNRT